MQDRGGGEFYEYNTYHSFVSYRQGIIDFIEIHYEFIGSLDDIHISPTERYMEYEKGRICEECGGEYNARNPAAKYCPSYREKVKARQAAEGYERRRQKQAAGA